MLPSLRVRLSFKIQIQFAEPNNRLNFFFRPLWMLQTLCVATTLLLPNRKKVRKAHSPFGSSSLSCVIAILSISNKKKFLLNEAFL